MPSVPSLGLLTRSNVTSFYGGSCSHRLKHRIQKSDRRDFGGETSFVTEKMEVCSHSILPVPEDISSLRELSVDSIKSSRIVAVDFSIDDIGKSVTEHLGVCNDQEFISGPVTASVTRLGDAKSEIGLNPLQGNTVTSEKCLEKSATFPYLTSTPSTSEPLEGKQPKDEDAESVSPSYQRSMSLPNPRKLVSAMKGSREKKGTTPPTKLTVKWAPDVYDPTPTAVSHVVTDKPQGHNKKNSKHKQKAAGSKNAKGSKSKDKKQGGRKHGGSSGRGSKRMDYEICY